MHKLGSRRRPLAGTYTGCLKTTHSWHGTARCGPRSMPKNNPFPDMAPRTAVPAQVVVLWPPEPTTPTNVGCHPLGYSPTVSPKPNL